MEGGEYLEDDFLAGNVQIVGRQQLLQLLAREQEELLVLCDLKNRLGLGAEVLEIHQCSSDY